MDTQWLDDLAALVEAGTLTRAAELRNVTQPAFSRRIQRIEAWLGVPVIDRTRRPARVTPAILSMLETIRALSIDLRQLRHDLRDAEAAERRVAIAAQHSISAGLLPAFIASLQEKGPAIPVRLRSANRDACYGLLMTGQVSFLVAYEAPGLPVTPDETLVERMPLGEDELCPVASPGMAAAARGAFSTGGRLRIIGFPPEVFFGKLLSREVLPRLRARQPVHVTCETALVPAALGLALEGTGVAWLPRTMCARHLDTGRLVELDSGF